MAANYAREGLSYKAVFCFRQLQAFRTWQVKFQ